MSLVALAIRTCLVGALNEETEAGPLVYDSAVTPIAELASKQPVPFIVVATEDEEWTVSGNEISAADRTIDIVIDVAVGSWVDFPVKDGMEYRLERSSHTDEGIEVSINLLTRNVMRVLQYGGGGWGQIYRRLVDPNFAIKTIRGADASNGTRFGSRQILITATVEHEPPFGQEELPDVWADFLAVCEADGMVGFAALVRESIIGQEVPSWDRTRARLGLSRDSQEALGLGPLVPGVAPAEVDEATIETTHETVVVSEDGDEVQP